MMCEVTNAGLDECLKPLLRVLNQGGFQTIASCCGHGVRPATIALHGGMEMLIMPFEEARKLDKLWSAIAGDQANYLGDQ